LILFVLVGVLAIGSAFASADNLPNDPNVNADANACYTGGTLAGRCTGVDSNGDGVISDDEVRFAWVAGWYLIRFQAGIIARADFPSQYAYLLPQDAGFPQCFDSTLDGYADYELLAPINTLLNAQARLSTDGTCTGTVSYALTLVTAPDNTSATTLCNNLGVTNVDPGLRSGIYPTLPPNTWMCED
jgi:hypothetical protein